MRISALSPYYQDGRATRNCHECSITEAGSNDQRWMSDSFAAGSQADNGPGEGTPGKTTTRERNRGESMSEFSTLHEMVRQARRNLSQGDWDYLMGGAETETTQRRNRLALDTLAFRPRVLNDVSTLDCSASLLGQTLRIPAILAPLGSIQVLHSAGAVACAEAADAFGTMMVLSSVCSPDFETVARAAGGPKVFQLYLMGDQAWMDDLIGRAIESGYAGFCLTVDTAVYSRRERDILKRYVPASGRRSGAGDFSHQARMTWATVDHIKQRFSIPLWLKGINRADDARRAVDHGADVVWVSNHGGRQLDHGVGAIDALPAVVAAVARRVPVVVDGGVMRGTDVLKALCLGADVVALGRLQGLAIGAGGARGIARMLEVLEQEIRTSLALLGAARLAELDPSLVERAAPVGAAHALSAFPFLEEGY
jgi:isopentenyl diphosphate isomerase/L-lactate dehydrogenase-like FMN-dependent dehydrogenase